MASLKLTVALLVAWFELNEALASFKLPAALIIVSSPEMTVASVVASSMLPVPFVVALPKLTVVSALFK